MDGGAIPARSCLFYGQSRLYHGAGEWFLPSGSRLARPFLLLHLIKLTLVFDPDSFLTFHIQGITRSWLECLTLVHNPGVIITYIAIINNPGRGIKSSAVGFSIPVCAGASASGQALSYLEIFYLHIFFVSVLH